MVRRTDGLGQGLGSAVTLCLTRLGPLKIGKTLFQGGQEMKSFLSLLQELLEVMFSVSGQGETTATATYCEMWAGQSTPQASGS